MSTEIMHEAKYIEGLIERARKAQNIARSFSQDRVDELSTAIAWTAVKEENARMLAHMAFEETQMGDFESKYNKLTKKVRGVQRDVKNTRTVGVVDVIKNKGIIKIAKPVGVIGALIPSTNPEVTPVIKAMFSIKGRNAIVLSPHPRSRKTTNKVVELMRDTLKKRNVPKDLIVCIENPDSRKITELMKQCDLVMATGGRPMVRAAYSSGTPAYGVGVGNAVVIVDETADIEDAAHKVMLGKTFDLATGCSSENSLIIHESIYQQMVDALTKEGGYLLSTGEKERLKERMWKDGVINRDIIGKPVVKISEIAGLSIPNDRTFIMVEESGFGERYPFSGEKLSVVLTIYRYQEFEGAIDLINHIHSYQGSGHSCGIHSFDDDHILQLGLKTNTSRIMVRQPQVYGNSGDWCNSMPFTVSMGCGTWGGNITTENVAMEHYLNITTMAFPIEPVVPTDEELFGGIMFEE